MYVVGTRTVAIVGLIAIYLSIGMDWVMGQALDCSLLHVQAFFGMPAASNSTYDGWAQNILVPYLVSPVQEVALILSPLGLVATIVAILRWRCMWVAGSLCIDGGILWTWGIYSIPSSVAGQLCSWPGYTGLHVTCLTPVLQTGPGPYTMVLGGAIMLAGYLLSREGVLAVPVE